MKIILGSCGAEVGGYFDTIKQVVESYKHGRPIAVFAADKTLLVGREEMEHCLATGVNMNAVTCFFGIDHAAWDATDCPELCAAARLAFYLPQQSPQSATVKAETGSGKSRITKEMFESWMPTKDDKPT